MAGTVIKLLKQLAGVERLNVVSLRVNEEARIASRSLASRLPW